VKPAAVTGEAGPLIFLVAAEPSGDLLAARLMAALRAETNGKIRFAGVGGEQMRANGLQSLFPIDELAVMGIFEVLPLILKVLRRVRETAAAAAALRPAALVTIDSPSFTLEVSDRLGGRGFPRIHYVAPSVWAWKPWRARKLAHALDHLLALLPFEPPYFERHGLTTTVVGHPAVEVEVTNPDVESFRARHDIPATAMLVCVLPGSRRSEVRHHEPVFAAALALLKQRFPDLHALVPTVSTVADQVTEAAKHWPVPALVLRQPAAKYQAFAAARAAIAVSGTVAVELAVAGLPAAIAYRVGPLSAVVGRLLIKIKYASLINLLLDRSVQPELLQENCTAEKLADTLQTLMTDEDERSRIRASYDLALRKLGQGGEAPSRKAARTILSLIDLSSGVAPGAPGG